jgi:hypothetical protein
MVAMDIHLSFLRISHTEYKSVFYNIFEIEYVKSEINLSFIYLVELSSFEGTKQL